MSSQEISGAQAKVAWEERSGILQFDLGFAVTYFVQVEDLAPVAALVVSPHCHSVGQSQCFAVDGTCDAFDIITPSRKIRRRVASN